MVRTAVTSLPRNLRSVMTNKPFAMAGVSGSSAVGRRYRDVVDALITEFGDADFDRIRELATLKVTREATQAAALKGDAEACETLIRLGNLIARREKELGRVAGRQASAASSPSLRARLAEKHGSAA